MKSYKYILIRLFKSNEKINIIMILLIIALFFLLSAKPIRVSQISFADIMTVSSSEDITEEDIEQELQDEINNQLSDLDFSSLEDILNALTAGELAIFGGSSFFEKLQKLINGDFDSGKGMWNAIINIFFENLLSLLPIISIIIAVSLIGSMIQGIKPYNNGKSISNIIHFVTYGVIVVLVLSITVKMVGLTTQTIQTMKSQMDAIFPFLLTFLTAIGGSTSVSVYQPAMALLTGTILNLFTYILLPIFIFSVVFSVVSNLSNSVKLEKFTSFFNSSYKWLTGLIFTIFTAFLSIQGITAGSIDGISIRTARYAIKSYIPILGSYLSDGMGIILLSSNLIKNAVGATGLFLLLATILSPLIELILFMLALKLIAGIIEPLGNKQIANFISSLSKSMVLLIILIIGIAFIYFIMLGLIMCSANIV